MDMLEIQYKTFSSPLLNSWKKGIDYSMLDASNASDYLKDIIVFKALRRKKKPNNRFFGEAYIASTTNMSNGWYNSFQWLTAKKWVSGKGLGNRFERQFYSALMTHIGPSTIKHLQKKAAALFNNHKEKFYDPKKMKYHKPVTPDLWLIGENAQFRFIESKLQTEEYTDTVTPQQLAGLALIKKYMIVSNPVTVSIAVDPFVWTDPRRG